MPRTVLSHVLCLWAAHHTVARTPNIDALANHGDNKPTGVEKLPMNHAGSRTGTTAA